MSTARRSPPPALRAGRRVLDDLTMVKILADLTWHESTKHWALHVRLRLAEHRSGGTVPGSSDWFVLIDPHYPRGDIAVFPARVGGLRATFPHQSYNHPGPADCPWRAGKLCLTAPSGGPLAWRSPVQEPRGEHHRLRWHLEQALRWLEAAARGELLQRDEPFELPVWPACGETSLTLVYAENAASRALWLDPPAQVGCAELFDVDGRYLAIHRWADLQGRWFDERRWGHVITNGARRRSAFWILLREVPKLSPWQAPRTWGELCRAARDQAIDLDATLRRLGRYLRGKDRMVLLVGFPIPDLVGASPREICWRGLLLPALSAPRAGSHLPGFRDNTLGRWMRDRQGPLHDSRAITWLKSENWHPDRIGARGRYGEVLQNARVAILGVGAIGSVVADLLVRGGVFDLLLIDGEKMAAGNLVRHRLRVEHLDEAKAGALAEELNLSSPHARVKGHSQALPWGVPEAQALLADRSIIIDCTGDGDPLRTLSACSWSSPKLFASVSVGKRARRLYFFAARGSCFPLEHFEQCLSGWLPEAEDPADNELLWEGAGCWHPLWPARLDDIMLMAAIAAKLLERAAQDRSSPGLQVFERNESVEAGFEGLERARLHREDRSS